jgi:hypothetical protein
MPTRQPFTRTYRFLQGDSSNHWHVQHLYQVPAVSIIGANDIVPTSYGASMELLMLNLLYS